MFDKQKQYTTPTPNEQITIDPETGEVLGDLGDPARSPGIKRSDTFDRLRVVREVRRGR